MENEFIIVNDVSLAALLRNTLEASGKRDPRFKFSDYRKFTKEELATITKLKLENSSFEDISVLEYCVNLKELEIRSANASKISTNFSSEAKFNYLGKKNKITDYSVISKLRNLQFLTIEFEDNLEILNLTGLEKLCSLTLSQNQHLTEVKGLDTLTGLLEIYLVRNGISHPFDLPRLMDGQLSDVVLDFDLYPILKSKYPDLANFMRKKSGDGCTCRWAENISDTKINKISTDRMEIMDKKAQEILGSIIGPGYSDVEKICAIYAYIIQNVKYDYEALNASKDAELRKNFNKTRGNLGERVETVLDRKQSSFNAILEGRSVCEGYTNMMHYLLNCAGIESVACTCSSESGELIVGRNRNHAVLRAKVGDDWLYFDPTWDAQRIGMGQGLKYFFKTKEEFNQSHSLTLTEYEILSPATRISNDELFAILEKVVNDRESGKNKAENKVAREQRKQPEETAKDIRFLKQVFPHINLSDYYYLVSEKPNDIHVTMKSAEQLLTEKGELYRMVSQAQIDIHQRKAVLDAIDRVYGAYVAKVKSKVDPPKPTTEKEAGQAEDSRMAM